MNYQTRQRQAVLSVLQSEDQPLSAHQIHERAKKECVGIGAATVFRTLKQLLQAGQIAKVEVPGVPPHYERAPQPHHHFFVCKSCKQLLPLQGCVTGLNKLLPKGTRMSHHEIIVFGECAACSFQ